MDRLSELILESLVVKRQHTDKHPAIKVGDIGELRDKIVKKIYEQENHRMEYDEYKKFISVVNESSGKNPPRGWVYKNKHLVQIKTIRGKKFVCLTLAGKNLGKKLIDKTDGDKV